MIIFSKTCVQWHITCDEVTSKVYVGTMKRDTMMAKWISKVLIDRSQYTRRTERGMQWKDDLYIDTYLPFSLRLPSGFLQGCGYIKMACKSAMVSHLMHYLDDYINWREQVSWSVSTTRFVWKTHVTSWVFWLPMKNVRIVSHNHIHKDQNRFLSHEAKIARGQTEEDSLWAGEMDWQKGQVEVRTRITAGTTATHIQDCKSSYVGRRGL